MHKYFTIVSIVFLTACNGWMVATDLEDGTFLSAGASGSGATGEASGSLDGAALYQRSCAACHGATGEGAPAFETSIQGFEPIEDLVINGRGTMPGMALPTEDIGKIQDFILSLAAPTESLDGAGLYGRYCASCHGADASGAPNWPSSIQAYEPIEEIVLSGRNTMPAIPVTAEQTAMIQEWLLTLAAPTADLDGEGLYTRFCASCHGADASGAPNWPSSIQGYDPIASIVMDGRGDMDPIALDAAQTQGIQDYLLTLAPPLSSLSGPEVYDRLCVGCHGDRGAGTDTKGMQLRYDDFTFSEFWIRAGRATTAYDSAMPDYPENMISDQQLTEMFEWIDDVPHPTDGEGLYNQYCANCHAMDGSGGPAQEGIAGSNDNFTGVIRNGKNLGNVGTRRSYMTAWSPDELSDDEIQLLSAYAAGL